MGKLKITADEFAERINNLYNGKYSVVKESYTGTNHQVTVYCNVHKIYFNVRASSLQSKGTNCPECYKEWKQQFNESLIIPFNEMLQRFKEAYGEKFSYDESSYHGMKELMKVHCNDCGEDFEITPEHHLKYNNGGCPNCHKYTTVQCYRCNKTITVDRRAKNSKVYCDECRQLLNQLKYKTIKQENGNIYIKCPFCGEYYKFGEQCINKLCNKHQSIIWYKKLIPFGFDFSKIGTLEYIKEYNKVIKIITKEYFDNGMSPKEIYDKYNCKEYFKSVYTITNILKSENYQVRNLSKSVQNYLLKHNEIQQNNKTKFKSGHHTTWDNKVFLLRSSYEFEFAKILDEQKISYEVEKIRIVYFDTQQNKERIAVPDFYLPETNTIIEVKSKWTLDKQNMIDKRDAYLKSGYNFKLWYEHEFVDLENIEYNNINLDKFNKNR